ncbi:glycohydrolase toxin TNT-related protein [Nocardia goodfellowii]
MAQRLANELGSPVHSATDAVGVPARPNSPAHIRGNGTWQTHTPQTASTPATPTNSLTHPNATPTPPTNAKPTDDTPVDYMGDTPPTEDNPDKPEPDNLNPDESKQRSRPARPNEVDSDKEDSNLNKTDEDGPVTNEPGRGRPDEDATADVASDPATPDDGAPESESDQDEDEDKESGSDEPASKEPDPNNPFVYTDGNAIPTDDLVHPDLENSELQRLQELDKKLQAVAQAHRDEHGSWPPPPPGVGLGHPAVDALLPSDFTRHQGQARDEWMAEITDDDGDLVWPNKHLYPQGFASPSDRTPAVLPVGEIIDRFGGPSGRFTSPPGVPFPERALPPTNLDGDQYHQYEVLRPLPVWAGPIAPAMDMPGGGTQHYLPASVQALIDEGYLREVPLASKPETGDASETPATPERPESPARDSPTGEPSAPDGTTPDESVAPEEVRATANSAVDPDQSSVQPPRQEVSTEHHPAVNHGTEPERTGESSPDTPPTDESARATPQVRETADDRSPAGPDDTAEDTTAAPKSEDEPDPRPPADSGETTVADPAIGTSASAEPDQSVDPATETAPPNTPGGPTGDSSDSPSEPDESGRPEEFDSHNAEHRSFEELTRQNEEIRNTPFSEGSNRKIKQKWPERTVTTGEASGTVNGSEFNRSLATTSGEDHLLRGTGGEGLPSLPPEGSRIFRTREVDGWERAYDSEPKAMEHLAREILQAGSGRSAEEVEEAVRTAVERAEKDEEDGMPISARDVIEDAAQQLGMDLEAVDVTVEMVIDYPRGRREQLSPDDQVCESCQDVFEDFEDAFRDRVRIQARNPDGETMWGDD